MKPKVLIVILVVVAALFVVALVVGGGQDDGSADGEQDGLVPRLGERFGDVAAVPRAAVQASCVSDDDPDLLVFGTFGCDVVVTSDWDDIRLLRMQPLTTVAVSAPAPEGDVGVDDTVDPPDEIKVAVGKGDEDRRTEISLGCPGLGECQVRLVDE